MKQKIFKKISLIGLTLFTTILSSSIVKAEESCITYDNYYFFNEINELKSVQNYLNNKSGLETQNLSEINGTNTWERSHAAYFPVISGDAKPPKNNESVISRRVCLSKNGKNDGNEAECVNNTWTLENFYDKELFLSQDPTVKKFIIDDTYGSTSYISRSEEKTDEDGEKVITTYYKHGRWFIVDNNGNIISEGGSGVNYINIEREKLVKGSFLPSLTSISLNVLNARTESAKGIINRTIEQEDINGVEAFDIAWKSGEEAKASVLTPGLYQVKYRLCKEVEDTPKYKATINYYYEGTTNRVEFKNDEPNPYQEENLEDGTTKDVKSPELKGCTVDKDNVTIKIEGKDFEENVYYNCEVEKTENPKTGSALIIIAWIIGLASLGYSVYYFIKLKKEENA